MRPLDPILVVHLFPEERAALLDLLSSLTPADWERPTVCPGWSIKDIAAHLLGDDLGRLSWGRDSFHGGFFEPAAGSTDPEAVQAELTAFINRQNEDWVAAARRLSHRVVVELLAVSGRLSQQHFETLNVFETGGPVHWAGPDPAPVWLDIAREFSERWLHQAQIRDALGTHHLAYPRLYIPLIDTLARALPHSMRRASAPAGAHVVVTVSGLPPDSAIDGFERPAGDLVYSLFCDGVRWWLCKPADQPAGAEVRLDGETAWRLFSKGISRDEAIARSTVDGDLALATKIFDTVSILA